MGLMGGRSIIRSRQSALMQHGDVNTIGIYTLISYFAKG